MAATINEIKKELEFKDRKELIQLCLRLARAKKESKELLDFAIFQQHDLTSFVEKIKEETLSLFKEINYSNPYFIKKSIRKILRLLNKNIRFAGSKTVEAELLIYFLKCFDTFHIPVGKSKQLQNIVNAQTKKIESAIGSLHPDLQYDFRKNFNLKYKA